MLFSLPSQQDPEKDRHQSSKTVSEQSYQSSLFWLAVSIILVCIGSPNRLFHSFFGALVGIAPLFWVCRKQSLGQQVKSCLTVWFPFCLYVFTPDLFSVEVLSSFEVVGGIVVAPLLPLFYVTATLLSVRLSRQLPVGIQPLAMAFVWTGLDGLLGLIWFPIPFHWGSLLYDWPVGIQIADLTGIWGVTFFAVFVNASLAVLLESQARLRQRLSILFSGFSIVLWILTYGTVRVNSYPLPTKDPGVSDYYAVGAIQQVGWLEADRSWTYRQERYQDLRRLSQDAVNQGARLVIWSEGSMRAQFAGTALETTILTPMKSILLSNGGLLLGAAQPDPETIHLPLMKQKFFNSALLYQAEGDFLDQFGKQWIFPYFESIRYRPSPKGYRPLAGSNLGNIGAMVCLESVLPEPSRQLVQQGADFLVAISDDSWFGNSNWPLLHANLSIFRAIENRRSFVFVNNTGGNVVVDPSGKIQKAGVIFQPDAVVGLVGLRQEKTLFTRLGDWFAWISLGITIGLGMGIAR
jgi:apolipoprotein N-acyltransferase